MRIENTEIDENGRVQDPSNDGAMYFADIIDYQPGRLVNVGLAALLPSTFNLRSRPGRYWIVEYRDRQRLNSFCRDLRPCYKTLFVCRDIHETRALCRLLAESSDCARVCCHCYYLYQVIQHVLEGGNFLIQVVPTEHCGFSVPVMLIGS